MKTYLFIIIYNKNIIKIYLLYIHYYDYYYYC